MGNLKKIIKEVNNLKYVKATICLVGLILITGAISACMLWDDGDSNVNTSTSTVANEVQENDKEETEEDVKRQAEEQAKKQAEEEAKRQAEEQAKKQAEEEAKRQAEEEAKKQEQANNSTSSTENENSNSNTSGAAASNPQQSFVASLNVAQQTDQLIVVQGDGGSSATISLHKKINGLWNQVLITSGNVGLNGITYNKQEGDRKTPAGVYSLGVGFGTAGNPGTSIPYRQITNNDYWVDDSNSPYYNQWVSTNEVQRNWSSAEHMASYPTQYNYGIAINYNTSCTPYKGSAIFLHCSTGNGTYGCVSVPRSSMISILNNVNSNCLMLIAPGNDIYNY